MCILELTFGFQFHDESSQFGSRDSELTEIRDTHNIVYHFLGNDQLFFGHTELIPGIFLWQQNVAENGTAIYDYVGEMTKRGINVAANGTAIYDYVGEMTKRGINVAENGTAIYDYVGEMTKRGIILMHNTSDPDSTVNSSDTVNTTSSDTVNTTSSDTVNTTNTDSTANNNNNIILAPPSLVSYSAHSLVAGNVSTHSYPVTYSTSLVAGNVSTHAYPVTYPLPPHATTESLASCKA
jgi:hypothetical protein